MKLKDVFNPKDLTVTSTLNHKQDYSLPPPNKIIVKGAWLIDESNFLLINWIPTDSGYACLGGGKQFNNRLIAKKVELLMDDNTGKLLSEILEMDLP